MNVGFAQPPERSRWFWYYRLCHGIGIAILGIAVYFGCSVLTGYVVSKIGFFDFHCVWG